MIEIREVGTDQEWQEYINIRHVVFIQEQDVPEEDEIDVYEKESTHFIATFDGQPAGTGRFRFKGGLIKFERIATLKKSRGKGVASAIMDFMEKRAKIKHSDYLPTMHAQVDVVSLYLERGWISIGKIFGECLPKG